MTIDPIERWNLAISAGAVATSLVLATPAFALSLALGAALEALNFRGLHRSARFLLFDAVGGARGWAAVFALRFSLLAICIGAALYFGAHAIALLLGLSLIMPALLIEAWRTRPPVLAGAPSLDADDPSWEHWNPWLAREEDRDSDEESR
jgi:hypothetical protein